MKFFLVLCLLALISCDAGDVFNCLIKQPKLVEFVFKIISLVATKAYDQIWTAVLAAIPDIITAVTSCL